MQEKDMKCGEEFRFSCLRFQFAFMFHFILFSQKFIILVINGTWGCCSTHEKYCSIQECPQTNQSVKPWRMPLSLALLLCDWLPIAQIAMICPGACLNREHSLALTSLPLEQALIDHKTSPTSKLFAEGAERAICWAYIWRRQNFACNKVQMISCRLHLKRQITLIQWSPVILGCCKLQKVWS